MFSGLLTSLRVSSLELAWGVAHKGITCLNLTIQLTRLNGSENVFAGSYRLDNSAWQKGADQEKI
jgi:hypothetical protein